MEIFEINHKKVLRFGLGTVVFFENANGYGVGILTNYAPNNKVQIEVKKSSNDYYRLNWVYIMNVQDIKSK